LQRSTFLLSVYLSITSIIALSDGSTRPKSFVIDVRWTEFVLQQRRGI
jgi:hypothetical protein